MYFPIEYGGYPAILVYQYQKMMLDLTLLAHNLKCVTTGDFASRRIPTNLKKHVADMMEWTPKPEFFGLRNTHQRSSLPTLKASCELEV